MFSVLTQCRFWLKSYVRLVFAIGIIALAWLLATNSSYAGQLSRAELEAAFAPPYLLGEQDKSMPVWPIIKRIGSKEEVTGYIFESIDFVSIPGFSGTPFNVLITLEADGKLKTAQVIAQHEPVFLDGLGPEPMHQFAAQYSGKSVLRNIRVMPAHTKRKAMDDDTTVDGVAKATASVHILNETIISAALTVARAKLNISAQPVRLPGRPKMDMFEKKTFAQLLKDGLVVHHPILNRDIEKLYAGTDAEGLVNTVLKSPDETYADIYMAYINTPIVGINLLGEAKYRKMMQLMSGDDAIWFAVQGADEPFGNEYIHGANPENIILKQAGGTLSIRDYSYDDPLAPADAPAYPYAIIRASSGSGFDPASPWEMDLRVFRKKGLIYPEVFHADIATNIQPIEKYFDIPTAEESASSATSGWKAIWKDRLVDVVILVAALAVLTYLLFQQKASTSSAKRFEYLRIAFLVFTLLIIGFNDQAQLSIVTLAGLVKAVTVTHDYGFLLWDPVSLVLWVYVITTAFIWGRGAFCGWLCPFGAMQELVAWVVRPLKIKQVKVPVKLDQSLRYLKYIVLIGFLAVAAFNPGRTETVAEVEPFKTAITLMFVRTWPFVLYAVLLVLANLFVYKAFCRYLCPLGAMMAILGKFRRWDWLKRRVECGSPCQLCKHQCRYGAISTQGKIIYDECFQCLDCVEIYHNPKRCVPIVLANRRQERAAELAKSAQIATLN